jgi:hypothetical protein
MMTTGAANCCHLFPQRAASVGRRRDNLRQQIVSPSVPVQDYRMSSTSGPDVTHAVVTNPRRAFQL